MKSDYKDPEMEIVSIAEDVITTSPAVITPGGDSNASSGGLYPQS